jgi:hypothetical protein
MIKLGTTLFTNISYSYFIYYVVHLITYVLSDRLQLLCY